MFHIEGLMAVSVCVLGCDPERTGQFPIEKYRGENPAKKSPKKYPKKYPKKSFKKSPARPPPKKENQTSKYKKKKRKRTLPVNDLPACIYFLGSFLKYFSIPFLPLFSLLSQCVCVCVCVCVLLPLFPVLPSSSPTSTVETILFFPQPGRPSSGAISPPSPSLRPRGRREKHGDSTESKKNETNNKSNNNNNNNNNNRRWIEPIEMFGSLQTAAPV